MKEKQISVERTWELPPRPCPCSLLGPLPAVLVLYQCPSPARRFQPVRCFRPARGSRTACGSRPARRSTPARRFPQSILLPALSAEIRKKKVKPSRRQFEPFSGRKSYVNPLEPMEARALEQKGAIS
ncbi:hypothetical protein OUZ56_026418 [Daphnia magna]|uniref:Uncharacterized protein n=1 Tax=Daphnia magna TaxID=35525 RepID=A0ABQ9ZLP1_9CRUS|nr:hypothetical protein OUZ56_026418 [Daphnia magna]